MLRSSAPYLKECPGRVRGLDESRVRACSCIPSTFKAGKILDIGCGSGMQTLALAEFFPDGQVSASDFYQPFLDELPKRAKTTGQDQRIVSCQASVDDLPFEEKSFDIIWAEGSAFVIGLSHALRYWKKFLKPDGFLVFSNCTWVTDSSLQECRDLISSPHWL